MAGGGSGEPWAPRPLDAAAQPEGDGGGAPVARQQASSWSGGSARWQAWRASLSSSLLLRAAAKAALRRERLKTRDGKSLGFFSLGIQRG